MKKFLLIIAVCLIACVAFAENYPFAVIVFPATLDSSIEAGPNAPAEVSSVFSKVINFNKSMCSFSFNEHNPFIKAMVEEGQLEESDLEYPVDEGNCERISEAMDADGYALVQVKSFVQDEKKFRAEAVVNIKIFKNGVEEPIFESDIKGVYGAMDGYWHKTTAAKAFEKCLGKIQGGAAHRIGRIQGDKYKDYKTVEPIVSEDEESEEDY
ncbi:MAG: hypothetical protein KBT47_08450 [Armatimonadetes bacterium]|nr:hypothetical protein [Candidatus Hippobium faecium]